MKQSIEMAIANAIASALAVRCPEGFNRPLPSCEKFILEEGDRFEIPMNFEVLATRFYDGGHLVPFIYVEVRDACDCVAPFRLYPTIFFRNVMDLDGRRISTKGTVPDALKYHRDYGHAMDFLKGKCIVVTGVHCVETRQPQTGRVVSRRVYDFDFC